MFGSLLRMGFILKSTATLLILFSFICFGTAVAFNFENQSFKETLPPDGGTIGPIEIEKPNTVLSVSVTQDIQTDNEWSTVIGELLDEKKNYLMGFSKEFWKESGYDSDGRWTEKEVNYESRLTVPDPGQYFLQFSSERSEKVNTSILVEVSEKVGSSLPAVVAGILALIIGVVLRIVGSFFRR